MTGHLSQSEYSLRQITVQLNIFSTGSHDIPMFFKNTIGVDTFSG